MGSLGSATRREWRQTTGLWSIPRLLQIPSIRVAKKPSSRPGAPDLDRSVQSRFPEIPEEPKKTATDDPVAVRFFDTRATPYDDAARESLFAWSRLRRVTVRRLALSINYGL